MSKFLPESIPIAEAARRLNISSKTLRRWEKKGLLLGSRTPGGHRRYQLSDLDRIAQLKRQKNKNQRLGFFRTHKEYIPIQEASKHVDVSTKTLRRWEERGLISSERTSGGHRRYLLPKIEEVAARIKREQAQHHPSPKPPYEIRIPPQVPIKIRETAVSSILVSEVPVLYQSLHVDQKRVFITILIFFVSFSLSLGAFKIIPDSLKSKVLGRFIPKEELANQEIGPSVLAEATGPTTFNVNVESNFNDNVNIKGKLAVNGGSITTTAPTFNLVNTNAKTLNVGGAATALSLGGTTGNTTINNNLAITGALSVDGDFTKIRGVTYSFPSTQGSASTYLKNDSTGTLSWATLSVPSKLGDLSGTLGVSNGGTGISSYTTGDILYASATTTLSKLAIGTSGQLLTVSGGLPAWANSPSSWSSLTNPTANLSLSMSTFTTTFNWATGTSTNNLFSFTSDASANGTGALVNIQSGASSTLLPLRVRAGTTEAITVNSSGNVGIGTTNPLMKLHVSGQSGFGNNVTTNFSFINAQFDQTNSTSDSWRGIRSYLTQSAGGNTNPIIAIDGGCFYTSASGNLQGCRGGSFTSVNTSTGTITMMKGTEGNIEIDSTGAITTAIQGDFENYAFPNSGVASSITTAYGVRAGVVKAGAGGATSTISTGYGVYIDTVGASTKFGLYQADSTANNYFAGNVGIGVTNPGTALSVNGIISGPSTQNLRLQATGATAGSGSNGSIYFLDSSGTTRGRFDTATLASYGTQADGPCTISSGSTNLTTGSCAGRGTADAVATAITAANNGTSTVTVTSTTGFAANDEVLLIQMTGTGAGNYETKTINYVDSSTQVTFKSTVVNSILNSYQSGAQMVRIPQYTSVTISSGATMTVSAWNGTTGGVLFLRATGTFSNSGTVDLNGLGGGGGTAGTAGNGGPGGSCNDNCSIAGNPGAGGGTGGTGTGPGAGGGTANGGGGGAGGSGGGGTGGGGAGSGGGGSGGAYGAATSTATTGATGGAGAGPTAAGGGGSAGAATAAVGDANFNRLMMGSGGQGGGGGGGGGGAGAQGENGFNGTGGSGGVGVTGGAGGAGGGLVVIAAATLTNSATIRANGAAGSNGSSNAGSGTSGTTSGGLSSGGGGGGGGTGGGGGGGSGGAVRLISNSLTAGTVTVTGGSGGSGGTTGGNGGGCAGAAAPKGGGGGGALGGTGGSAGCATSGSTASSSPTGTGATGSVGRTLNSTFAYGTLYAAALNTIAADLAEYYVTGDKSIESGDVVSISDSKVLGDNSQEITNKGVLRKATIPYDSKLIGIISTSPGVILGSIDGKTGQSDSRALALAGRVPVKIALDSQPILIGDFLTSSDTHPGMAMKATKAGYTVAKALETWVPCQATSYQLPATNCGSATIEAFVSLGYYLGPMTADGYIDTAANFIANNIKVSLSSNDQLRLLGQSPTVASSATDSSQVASDSASPDTNVSVSQAITKILDKLQTLEGEISLLKAASTSASPSSLATNYQLLTTNQLTVLGNSLLGDTVINGKLNVGVLSFDNKDGSLQAIGPLKIQPLAIDSIQFAGDTIEMDKNGNLTINKGVISGNSSIRDAANVSPGQTSISVVKSWDKSPVSIQATPSYKTTVWVTNITSSGFTINVSDSPTEPQKLFWWAVW